MRIAICGAERAKLRQGHEVMLRWASGRPERDPRPASQVEGRGRPTVPGPPLPGGRRSIAPAESGSGKPPGGSDVSGQPPPIGPPLSGEGRQIRSGATRLPRPTAGGGPGHRCKFRCGPLLPAFPRRVMTSSRGKRGKGFDRKVRREPADGGGPAAGSCPRHPWNVGFHCDRIRYFAAGPSSLSAHPRTS